MEGVADRLTACASGGTTFTASSEEQHLAAGVKSLKNVLVFSYTADAKDGADKIAVVCLESSAEVGGSLKVFPKVEKGEAELLATCMESKVGEVFLKSHIKSSAADCIATVMPALSPDRAKQLGVYWQTPEQLAAEFPHGN